MRAYLLGLILLMSQTVVCSNQKQLHPYIYCQKKWKELKWEGLKIQILKLRAEKFPEGKAYTLIIRNCDGSETEVFNYVANKKGHLIVDITEDLKKGIPFAITPLRKGEKISYCMLSEDQTEKYITSIVPFPIEVEGDQGSVSIELLDVKGESFMCVGQGFQPNKEIQVTCQSGQSNERSWVRVNERGGFHCPIYPAIEGKEGGNAVVLIKTKEEQLSLPFVWGKEAQEFIGAICLQI